MCICWLVCTVIDARNGKKARKPKSSRNREPALKFEHVGNIKKQSTLTIWRVYRKVYWCTIRYFGIHFFVVVCLQRDDQ